MTSTRTLLLSLWTVSSSMFTKERFAERNCKKEMRRSGGIFTLSWGLQGKLSHSTAKLSLQTTLYSACTNIIKCLSLRHGRWRFNATFHNWQLVARMCCKSNTVWEFNKTKMFLLKFSCVHNKGKRKLPPGQAALRAGCCCRMDASSCPTQASRAKSSPLSCEEKSASRKSVPE